MKRRTTAWMTAAVMMTAMLCAACGETVANAPSINESVDSGETVMIELTPAVDSYQEIDTKTLDRVCSALKTRLDSAGVEDYSVSIDDADGDVIVTYPRVAEESVPKELLTQVGRLAICDPDGGVALDNDDLESANARVDMTSDAEQYVIVLTFTEAGAEKFEELTEEYINRETGFYIDDELIFSPTIQAVISDGMAMVSGDLTAEKAALYASLIAAPLPFPLAIETDSLKQA